MSHWISTADAFRIAETFKTFEGLRRCGVQNGFARKAPDGHHFVFDRYQLQAYLRRLTNGKTVREIAEESGVTISDVHHQIIKLGLTPTAKRGPQFVFSKKDSQLLSDIHQALHLRRSHSKT